MEKALKIKLIAGTILVCALLTAGAIFFIEKYTPSETMRTLDNYYDVAPEEAVIILENEIYKEHALLREGGIYLSLDMVLAILNGDFYLDDWHNFLKEIYGNDIGMLNSAYGSSYGSFEEIPLSYTNDVMEYDYKMFNDKVFSEWHRWMAGIVHELAPDVPLHSKIMNYLKKRYVQNLHTPLNMDLCQIKHKQEN